MRTTGAKDAVSVLVVEDDETIGRHVAAGLRSHGYAVTWTRTGGSGLTEAARLPIDVVLLDLGLPDMDGIDVARQLRDEHSDVLILILTARSEEIDVIEGLDAGADDYLAKPFSMNVLLARLRAHLRRRPPTPVGPDEPIRIGDLTVDTAARRCHLGDREVDLRPKEFELLAVLARHPGEAVSRESLMAQVWDENWFGPTKTLDVTISSLRRRLETTASAARTPIALPAFTTLRGHGYRLDPPGPLDGD
ncbi:response regulator transcription factor [Streptomyces rugosispiralis]|uniref:Response regulator transcription factor n=1 Tax=Streptomyces rugosispiralis TaxID=2967341 RepID=A0ABT1VBA0_9ACTN|nr:response regulator transcription factor [Streptomyces rugosispiralis]MCQ8193786.1 response regulator transcription factor [Streptomyces rugosispiralis]